jgi:hypothetical protein
MLGGPIRFSLVRRPAMRTTVRTLLLCAIAIVASGMSPPREADEALGMVKGAVTLNGVPLKEGKLSLHTPGAKPIELPIKDGKYAGDKVPTGAKTVTIEGAGVPAKYGSPETTSLTVEIKAGANELVFDLTS